MGGFNVMRRLSMSLGRKLTPGKNPEGKQAEKTAKVQQWQPQEEEEAPPAVSPGDSKGSTGAYVPFTKLYKEGEALDRIGEEGSPRAHGIPSGIHHPIPISNLTPTSSLHSAPASDTPGVVNYNTSDDEGYASASSDSAAKQAANPSTSELVNSTVAHYNVLRQPQKHNALVPRERQKMATAAPMLQATASAAKGPLVVLAKLVHGLPALDATELMLWYNKEDKAVLLRRSGNVKEYQGQWNDLHTVGVRVASKKNEPAQQQLEHEMQVVGFLYGCPRVISVFGVANKPRQQMMVLEYLNNGSLKSLLQTGELSWYNGGSKLATQIAEGLLFLHSRRVVLFGSFQPEHLLLTPTADIKFGDFKQARRFSANREYSSVLFQEGASKDVFVLGVILHSIIKGKLPENLSKSRRVVLAEVTVPTECPREVAAIVAKCLGRKQERPSAQQVATQLRALRVAAVQTE